MYSLKGNGSIAHTTGNITFLLVEKLKSIFGEEFFHHIHITTRMPYREFLINENRKEDQFIKKNRPILIVKPKVIMGNDDIFMSKSAHIQPVMHSMFRSRDTEYIGLFRDNVNDITLTYLMNRLRVQLECTIMLDTEYQQTNIYSQMLNLYNERQIYWMNAATECYVPRDIIEAISKISGKPIRNPETGLVRDFLNYLTGNSSKYFTFKEKTASQTEEFFVYYPLTIEYVFTDYNKSEMQKHGDVSGSADINFILSAEFNTIGMYQLLTERDDVVEKANAQVLIDTSHGMNIIPIFTVQNLFKEVDEHGWKLFYSNIFSLDPDIPRGEPDILDLSGLFKESMLREVLEYHKKNGITNDILFNIYIMKNNTVLNCDKSKGKISYKVELEKQRVLIYNKTYSATYRIVIYINNLYIMTLMNRLNNLEDSYEVDIHKDRR